MEVMNNDFNRRNFLKVAGVGAVAASSLGSALASAQVFPGGPSSPPSPGTAANLPYAERGNFAYKATVAPHQPSAKAMLDQRGYFGLVRSTLGIYGCLRDANGEMYEITRSLPGPTNPHPDGAMFLEATVGKDTLRIVPEVGANAATSANHREELLDDGTAVWTSDPAGNGNPFRITFAKDGTSCTWHEENLCDFQGQLLGPGLQWYLPTSDTGILYVSQLFQLQGTLQGKAVRGMIGFDDIYLPQGVNIYDGNDPLTKHDQHRIWYTFATRYKDGTYDAGHIILGHDRLGFALLTNEKQKLTLCTDVTGEVTQVSDGPWPQSIKVHVQGVDWEFLPDPKGRMPDLQGQVAAEFTPQNEGRWRRVGDRREPDVWFAWGEIAPAHGLDYKQRLRY